MDIMNDICFLRELLPEPIKGLKENENPSVGMTLCASKDDEVVEYVMSRTLSPMMVAFLSSVPELCYFLFFSDFIASCRMAGTRSVPEHSCSWLTALPCTSRYR